VPSPMHQRHLELANRHIADAERRLARQAAIVSRLAEAGYETAQAENLLRLIRESLQLMEAHRHIMLATNQEMHAQSEAVIRIQSMRRR